MNILHLQQNKSFNKFKSFLTSKEIIFHDEVSLLPKVVCIYSFFYYFGNLSKFSIN